MTISYETAMRNGFLYHGHSIVNAVFMLIV